MEATNPKQITGLWLGDIHGALSNNRHHIAIDTSQTDNYSSMPYWQSDIGSSI